MNELINDSLELLKCDLESGIEHYKKSMQNVRAGRANSHILDAIKVDYYGTPTPINQVAGVSTPEARMIVVSPWDATLIKPIKKAVEMANLGVNISDDGKIIRLGFPTLTEERRKDLTKEVKKMAEEQKVAFRNSRRDILDEGKKYKKDSKITEDELAGLEQEVQKILNGFVLQVDNITAEKQKEIMAI